ncbi:hypothetical protein D3C72_2333170 [compost metagenome]
MMQPYYFGCQIDNKCKQVLIYLKPQFEQQILSNLSNWPGTLLQDALRHILLESAHQRADAAFQRSLSQILSR